MEITVWLFNQFFTPTRHPSISIIFSLHHRAGSEFRPVHWILLGPTLGSSVNFQTVSYIPGSVYNGLSGSPVLPRCWLLRDPPFTLFSTRRIYKSQRQPRPHKEIYSGTISHCLFLSVPPSLIYFLFWREPLGTRCDNRLFMVFIFDREDLIRNRESKFYTRVYAIPQIFSLRVFLFPSTNPWMQTNLIAPEHSTILSQSNCSERDW